jgi:hypothetical protein
MKHLKRCLNEWALGAGDGIDINYSELLNPFGGKPAKA